MRRVASSELVGVLLWSVAVMALTAVPYLQARNAAGPDREFGGFIWGVDDGNVYLSWVRQAAEGRVLLRDQYTLRQQSPHFFNLFLLVLGRLAALTGLGPLALFAGSRYVFGVFCLVALYYLAAEFTADRRVRWLGLILASVSSGLGWVVVMMGQGGTVAPGLAVFPMDVADGWQAQPEAIVFLSLLLNPLFSLSLGLVCLVMKYAARLTSEPGYAAAVWTGLFLLLLGNVHGYDIFALHLSIGVWMLGAVLTGRLSLRRGAGRYGLVLLLSLASPIWACYGAKADPSYAAKVSTPTLSRPPLDVAVGYGLVLVLAVVGAWLLAAGAGPQQRRRNGLLAGIVAALGLVSLVLHLARAPQNVLGLPSFGLPIVAGALLLWHRAADDERWRRLLPVVWAACGAAVIYLPVPFQRKMMEGLHIPLCILAAWALVGVWERLATGIAGQERASAGCADHGPSSTKVGGPRGALSRPVVVSIVAALVLATVPSNVLFVAESMRHVLSNNRTLLHVLTPPAYLERSEVEALRWLAGHTTEEDVVFCSNLTGNYIPAYAPCLVMAGHWAETISDDYPVYLARIAAFYDPSTAPETRERLLSLVGATVLWWGPQERLLATAGGGVPRDPGEGLSGYRMVYENSGVRIYGGRDLGASDDR